jgi:hypothetical protein
MDRPAAGVLAVLLLAATAGAVPIPQDPLADPVPAYVGAPAVPQRVRARRIPEHPFMAPNGVSNIHDDGYQSDTYTAAGPLGRTPAVISTYQQAECASVTFDRQGRLLTICVGVEGPRLARMDPVTLDIEAVLPLPPRANGSPNVFSDFSGGGYFYLDHLDRVVTPTNTRQVWIIGQTDDVVGFAVERIHDLTGVVPFGDGVISVLPDWSGRLWFATVQGRVGTIHQDSGEIHVIALDGEAIGNSFAVDDTGGVFIVSDHALYRFDADADGAPAVTWREVYDRGTRLKPGQTNFGSGTTPTLMGRNWVAITDNADPYMQVVVYWRRARFSRPRHLCSVAVFGAQAGATENSLMGTHRSLVVENNYGYSGLTSVMNGATTEPGLARIDVRASGCRLRWTSPERVPSVVSKLSLATGLVYTYTKPADPSGNDAWYFTALDYRKGTTVYKRLAGTGLGFNNHYAPISLGPDGTAYVGSLGGLVLLRDR